MPMHWNDRTDAKLFTAILKIHNIKVNYEKVAELMGPECTPKAISHRISKLKEKCKGDFAGIHVEPVHAADAFIPKQRATSVASSSSTPAPASTARRRGRPPKRPKKEVESGDEEDEEEEQTLAERGSPSIRKKAKIVSRRQTITSDSPNSSSTGQTPSSDVSSSTPATLESLSSPPETAAAGEHGLKPIPQPNFLPNVKTEPVEEESELNLLESGDNLSSMPLFFSDDAVTDPSQDPHMSFMNMSFDFWSPEWDNYRVEDTYIDYNE